MIFKRQYLNKFIYIVLSVALSVIILSCKSDNDPRSESESKSPKYSRFVSYDSFKDKPELHMSVATSKGVGPLESRNDTLKHMDKLHRLADELDMYKLDKLTHSMPFLIDDAASLLVEIGINFRDSLKSKQLPPYKLIVTSVTRTREDVNNLSKRNSNASENSVHCYGTTFDISWKRFQKIGPPGEDDVSPDKLKYVLGQVIHDLRERQKCYVVHEKKQACFHVTVR